MPDGSTTIDSPTVTATSTGGTDVVEAVSERLESLVTSRTVYRRTVPKQPVARYYLVTAATGVTESYNLADGPDYRAAPVWVTSVARGTDAAKAAEEAEWGSVRVVDALTGWRATLGQATYRTTHVASGPPQRNDALTDFTVSYANQFNLSYQP